MSSGPPATAPAPLIGDPARQAVDSLLGYDYQIWRTVELWIQLGPQEALFIECAEDFDVVTSDSGTAHQVKNSPGSITLRSADVREAISNHITALQKNPTRTLRTRFLTRGDIGSEQGKPFAGERGIEVWRKAASGDAAAEQALSAYLAQNLSDPTSKAFLTGSTPDQRRVKLYAAMDWVVNEPVIEAVRDSVRRQLIEIGNGRGIATQYSERSVDALLARCREVAVAASPESRCLTSQDFQSVFHSATSVQLPATESLVALLGQMVTFAAGAALPVVFSPFQESGEAPPLPGFVMPRADLCDSIASALNSGAVLIVGSEGKGKSLVANLFARRLGAAFHWRELPEDFEQVCVALERMLALARSERRPRCMVIDDVPAALGLRQDVWTRLLMLIEACKGFGVVLLMTAKGVPEEKIDSRFRGAGVSLVSVPVLTEGEVADFFSQLGCPAERQLAWTKMTLVHTGNGHPKLVYLRGLELRDEGWPAPTADAYLSPPVSIEEARVNAAWTVSKTVQDPAKTFLYLLSMTLTPFTRQAALKVGELVGLSSPGEDFDRLLGRWVEARGKNTYQVTSLLNGQAQKNYTPASLAKKHALLFDAFTSDGSIGVSDAWGVLLHATLSFDATRFGRFIATLVMADFKALPGLADSLDVLLSMWSGNVLAGGYDARTTAMFRHLQFKIAAASRPEQTGIIANQWAWAIDQISDDQARNGMRVIKGMCLVIAMNSQLSGNVLVRAVADAARFEHVIGTLPKFPEPVQMLTSNGASLGYVGQLFVIAQSRCDGFSFVDSALGELDGIEPSLRSRMLESFSSRFAENVSMIAKAWLVENRKEPGDWVGLLHVLARAKAFALKWNAPDLGRNVARISSVIYDEEQDVRDEGKAISILLEAAQAFGDSAVLADQRANMNFRAGRYREALLLWERCLDLEMTDLSKIRDPFSCRKAAMAAFEIGECGKAAMIFERGRLMSIPEGGGPVPAAYDVDAAFCWWQHNDPERALNALARANNELNGNYDPVTEFQRFRAQKHCGSCALWMLGKMFPKETAAIDDDSGPQVGCATSPDRQEPIADLPPSAGLMTASMITRVASRLAISSRLLTSLRDEAMNSRIPMAVVPLAKLVVDEAIASANFNDFGNAIEGWRLARWRAVASYPLHRIGAPVIDLVIPDEIKAKTTASEWHFSLAMALLRMSGADPIAHATTWKEQISSRDDPEQLLMELAEARAAFDTTITGARGRLRASPPTLGNIGAAAVLLSGQDRRPGDTAYAQIGLLTWFYSSSLDRDSLEAALPQLADAFSNQWRLHIRNPGTLNTPRLSVPALAAAVDSGAVASERLLQLIIAASHATGQSLPQYVLNALSETTRLAREAERLSASAAQHREIIDEGT